MCVATRGTIISSFGEKIGPLWQERLQYEKGKYCRSRLFQENPDGQFAFFFFFGLSKSYLDVRAKL